MREDVNTFQEEEVSLRTVCGREFGNTFKAIKLMRDERHNFHVVYKTFENEYIYSFCNPFLDVEDSAYQVISEAEAKRIFLPWLSQDNACELFSSPTTTLPRLHA